MGETFDTTPTFSWRAEDPDGSQVTVTATVVGQQQEVITHHNGYYEFDINALPEERIRIMYRYAIPMEIVSLPQIKLLPLRPPTVWETLEPAILRS